MSTLETKLFTQIPDIESKEGSIFTEYINRFFKRLVDTRDDYPAHWQTLLQGLKEIHTIKRNTIHFGPEYHIGEENPFTVSILFIDYAETNFGSRRDFVLLIKNQFGEIVGDCFQPTNFDKKSNSIEANGLICMDPKNRGGAAPLTLVLWHILQTEANIKNSEVKWIFRNSNYESLQALNVKYNKTKDEFLLPKIRDMQAQQQRWQAMYGFHGKFNVDKDSIKRLFPKDQEPYENLESIKDIKLARVEDEKGQSYPKLLAYKTIIGDKDKQSLRALRLAELESLFTSKTKVIVQ